MPFQVDSTALKGIRVLDLSRSAAEALDMIRRGVIDARVEVLERPE